MMRAFKAIKILSFISSMFPLSIYLILNYFGEYNMLYGVKYLNPHNIVVAIAVLEFISIIYIIVFYKKSIYSENNNYIRVKLENPIQEKTNTSNYLLANVLPIITFEMDNANKIIFICILILLLGYMYIKNNLYYINPLYDIINVRIYNCKIIVVDNTGKTIKVLDKIVVSKFHLYKFENRVYKAIEEKDTVVIVEEID